MVALSQRQMLLAGVVLILVVFAGQALLQDDFPRCKACERKGHWHPWQQHLAAEAKVAAASGEPLDVVFVGDSITEALRGSSYGSVECLEYRCDGIPAVFNQEFGHLKTLVLAISGDQTEHVSWRLRHGEGVAVAKARSAVLLIGTNDLSQAVDAHVLGWRTPKRELPSTAIDEVSNSVFQRVRQAARDVRAAQPSDAPLVLVGVLPRGPSFRPPAFEWPNGIYTMVLSQLNKKLAQEFEADEKVIFVECGEAYIDQARKIIPKDLMPDGMHPSAVGTKHWLACAKEALRRAGVLKDTASPAK